MVQQLEVSEACFWHRPGMPPLTAELCHLPISFRPAKLQSALGARKIHMPKQPLCGPYRGEDLYICLATNFSRCFANLGSSFFNSEFSHQERKRRLKAAQPRLW